MINVQGITISLFPIARHQNNASWKLLSYTQVSLAALSGSKFCSRPADTNLRLTSHSRGLIDYLISKDPLSKFSNNCYLSRVKLVS